MQKEKCTNCNEIMEPVSVNSIAIEFAKWCGKRYFYNENNYAWVLGTEKYTTEALFEKFIEQRKQIESLDKN